MSEETKDQAAATKAPEPEADGAAEATAQAKPESEPDAAAEAKSEAAAESKTSVQQSNDDDDAVLDATGRERPRFLLAFPQDPDLSRLAAAFEAGNYALVRAEAEALAERTESPAVRDAALELRRRIDPDPLAKYLLALTAGLLLFLAYFAYHH
jgi:hypothetical protein